MEKYVCPVCGYECDGAPETCPVCGCDGNLFEN